MEPSFSSNISDYELTKTIGKGSQGNVWSVRNKIDGNYYALKVVSCLLDFIISHKCNIFENFIIFPTQVEKNQNIHKKILFDRLKDEVKIWKSVSEKANDQSHVVKLLHYFDDESNVYLVSELCQKLDLSKKLKQDGKLPEQEAKLLFKQVCLGAKFLKDNLVLHRDFKPGNLFMTDKDIIKIGDFG